MPSTSWLLVASRRRVRNCGGAIPLIHPHDLLQCSVTNRSVNLVAPSVKARRYDNSSRQATARARRQRVLDTAARLMQRDGYDATTVAAIATESGVSPETIYKSLGGKTGLVRALLERALEGAGPVPA